MAGVAVDVSTGLTLTFATSSFTAQILSANWTGASREPKATSHMATAAPSAGETGNMTYIPGDLSDPGELQFTMHFATNTQPPLDSAAETVTITWPLGAGDAANATLAGTGFMTSFEVTADLDEVMEASATVKFSGNLTWTDSTT